MRKTKIVFTLGPATDDESVLRDILANGGNVARLNFSHGTHADHLMRSDMLKKLREEMNLPIALMLDTKGPEIRFKLFKEGKVALKQGQQFTLTGRDIEGTADIGAINFPNLSHYLEAGDILLLDDGLISLTVQKIKDMDIICHVNNDGPLSNNKKINTPGKGIPMAYLSEIDKADIAFGVQNGFDFLAASFVRSSEDVKELRSYLASINGKSIKIIAKIENRQGVDNIEDIIRASDAIMVARGDMGVEIDLEALPELQKLIIKKTVGSGKPVITATQMLESMIKNPRPTRAEVTDIANSIYDGTSAIMLSGETSVGKYPVDCIKTMQKIAISTEKSISTNPVYLKLTSPINSSITSAISHATCTTAQDLNAKAILTTTVSGQTARMVSSFRPNCPIIAITPTQTVRRQMNLSWGVIPLCSETDESADKVFDSALEIALEYKLIKPGDLVVQTAGLPVGIPGTTNVIKVTTVGDVLIKGTGFGQQPVQGHAFIIDEEDTVFQGLNYTSILVLKKSTPKHLSLLKNCLAVITEESDDSPAVHGAIALGIPVIYNAIEATTVLKSGMPVTLSPVEGIVFNGFKD